MSTNRSGAAPILVLGSTGKTGSRVLHRLAQAGHPTRSGSRRATPRFDWDDRSTWAPALEGVAAVYVAYQPDIAVPGALDTVSAFFELARDSDAGPIVLLSGRGEAEAQLAEQALQASAARWTILRASWFCQNFSEGAFLDAILAGELVLPTGLAAEPFVDVEDIADIACQALTGTAHSGQLYEITGRQALTFAQATRAIAMAVGRDIAFVEVSPDDYRAALVQQGVAAGEIELITYLFATVLDGRNVPLGDGVQRALGRPPGSFVDYARRTAAQGVWQAVHA
jgi:uncharacterized protein YbjT (DUF2867 family)